MSAASNALRLRPVRSGDEATFRAARAELAAADFPVGLGYEPDAPWEPFRRSLDDHLDREGGHIGCAVLAAHRGRGYATEIRRQRLVIARAVGVDRMLSRAQTTTSHRPG